MIGNYKLSILIIWNLLWGGFAIDQLGMTYELVNQEKNIYGDKIVVEENGVKFLRDRKDTDIDNITKNRVCRSKALWEESFNYNFDFIKNHRPKCRYIHLCISNYVRHRNYPSILHGI